MIVMCPHCGGLNRVADETISANPTCGKCHKPVFLQKPIEMNSEQFVRALNKTDQILLVDFWASWCGPCKSFAPIFSQAASILPPQVKLVKINTETEQHLATQFNIRSIPTLAIFKNGNEVNRISGALGLNELVDWVKSQI